MKLLDLLSKQQVKEIQILEVFQKIRKWSLSPLCVFLFFTWTLKMDIEADYSAKFLLLLIDQAEIVSNEESFIQFIRQLEFESIFIFVDGPFVNSGLYHQGFMLEAAFKEGMSPEYLVAAELEIISLRNVIPLYGDVVQSDAPYLIRNSILSRKEISVSIGLAHRIATKNNFWPFNWFRYPELMKLPDEVALDYMEKASGMAFPWTVENQYDFAYFTKLLSRTMTLGYGTKEALSVLRDQRNNFLNGRWSWILWMSDNALKHELEVSSRRK